MSLLLAKIEELKKQNLIKEGSKAEYHLTMFQRTIHPSDFQDLTPEGEELYNLIQLYIITHTDFERDFEEAEIRMTSSGAWFPNSKSKWYDPNEYGMLCTYKNASLISQISPDKIYCTSPILFYKASESHDEYGWAYTMSGKFYRYKLGKVNDQFLEF